MAANIVPSDDRPVPLSEHASDPKEPLHVESTELSEPAPRQKPQESDESLQGSIPINLHKPGKIMPIILIASNIFWTILLAVFVFRPVYYFRSSNIVTQRFATMLLAVSLPPTLLGLFTMNHMGKLFVRRFIHLAKHDILTPREREKSTVAVGVASFMEDLRGWRIGMSYGLASLIVSMSVSCLTPTLSAEAHVYPDHDLDSCFAAGSNRSTLSAWSWQLEGPVYMGVNRSASPECESEKILNVVSTIGAKHLSYAYPVGGLLVDRNAVGAPVDPMGNSSGEFGSVKRHSDFLWTRQCFPAVTRNPVSCRTAPNSTFKVTSTSLQANITSCTALNGILMVNPMLKGATAVGVCPEEKKFGSLKIVFAAVNEAVFPWMDGMQEDKDIRTVFHDSINRSRIAYAVSCSIDIEPTISYRRMTLERISGYLAGIVDSFLFHITGDPFTSCSPKDSSGMDLPLSRFLMKRSMIAGAVGIRPFVLENADVNGMMASLHAFVSLFNPQRGNRLPADVYTFKESRNALEDAIGTINSMTLGMYWGAQIEGNESSSIEITDGEGGASGWRMGTGQPQNVIYVLPTLASALILSYSLYIGVRDGYI